MTKITLKRQLHLVDIENLLGDPRPSECAVSEALALYAQLVDVRGPNQIIVACNHGAASAVGCCLGEGPRLLVRSGHNGADEALLDVLATERVEERFTEVILASGDGIFASHVAELTSRGIPVTVVARRDSLSARLRLASSEIVYFESPEPPVGSIAMAVAA